METTTLSTSRQLAVRSASALLGPGSEVASVVHGYAGAPFGFVVWAMGDASALSFDAVRTTLHGYRLALAATQEMTRALVASVLPAAPSKAAPAAIVIERAPTRAPSPGILAAIEGEFMPAKAEEAPSSAAPRSSRRKRR